MSNYDWIRGMTINEMAEFISSIINCTSCPQKEANCNKASDCIVTIRCWLEHNQNIEVVDHEFILDLKNKIEELEMIRNKYELLSKANIK